MRPGWEIKTLGDISVMMADGPFGSNLKKEHYTENREVRIIQLSNIGEDGWREENTKYTTFKHLETIKRSEVFPNDIVIAKMMPAGRAIICPNHEKKFVLSSDAVKVQLKKGINLRFAWYSINSPYFRKQVYENVAGSGRVRTSLTKLKVCKLRLPSLPEQQRIVDILDQEFAKIDALKANAEKSLQAAKDLFSQMLSQTFANPSWSRKRIGDVFDTGAGGTPLKTYKEYYENGNVPWLRSGEVCRKYITETEMFITQLGMDNSSAKLFPENTIVVAMYGATAGQVGILHLETTTNQAVCGIFPRTDYIPEFVYYSLLNSKKGLVAQATGNAQPNISQIKIKNTSIPVVSREEQELVVARLDDLNDKCNVLQDNYQKTLSLCDDLKQSLLRKAFNGEL